MTDAIRTPDVLLDGLPGFPWAARFRSYDGLRLAHVDGHRPPWLVDAHGDHATAPARDAASQR